MCRCAHSRQSGSLGAASCWWLCHSTAYQQHCRTRAQDKAELTKVTEAVKASFNDRVGEIRKKWGGNIMGLKSNHKSSAKAKAIAREEAKRNQ